MALNEEGSVVCEKQRGKGRDTRRGEKRQNKKGKKTSIRPYMLDLCVHVCCERDLRDRKTQFREGLEVKYLASNPFNPSTIITIIINSNFEKENPPSSQSNQIPSVQPTNDPRFS